MAISNYTAETTTGEAVSSNPTRKALVISNLGTQNVFLNIGADAEVNKGILLLANGGTWTMQNRVFSIQNITAITASSTSLLSIYEV
jgi:hypothetical protein